MVRTGAACFWGARTPPCNVTCCPDAVTFAEGTGAARSSDAALGEDAPEPQGLRCLGPAPGDWLTVDPAHELLQHPHFHLNPGLGKGVVVLREK